MLTACEIKSAMTIKGFESASSGIPSLCLSAYKREYDTMGSRIYAGTELSGVAVGLPPRSVKRRVRFPVSAPNNAGVV